MVRRLIRNHQLNIGGTWLPPHLTDAPPSTGFQSCQRQDCHSTHHLRQRKAASVTPPLGFPVESDPRESGQGTTLPRQPEFSLWTGHCLQPAKKLPT
uniref:Uncharacterized protein n=1 Tax=Oryza meridionalis TaxID=40149 RepID=A0A0E0C749_9ORYZ